MKNAFYLCLKLKGYLYNDKYMVVKDNYLLQNDKVCVDIKLTINK
jgi:hypothetical protein